MLIDLFIAVAVKALLIGSVYSLARYYYNVWLERLLVAYLGAITLQTLVMLVLSCFGVLNAKWLIVGMIICASVFVVIAYWRREKEKKSLIRSREHLRIAHIVIIIVFLIVFIGLLVRPFFYYDTTDDALIQGMPKLAFIQQHASLFVNYKSITINTFSNEWLGELNGLFYMFVVGIDRAAGFGNVEVFLFLTGIFLYVPRAIGYNGQYQWEIAFAGVTWPVVLGLSMTIKTDLFAIGLLPLCVAFLVHYYKTEGKEYLFASILTLGAASGAKISILPATGLLLIALVIFYFFQARKKYVLPVILGGSSFVINCFRYLLNLIQYHNPFQRAINEKASFSVENLVNSFLGLLLEYNETPELIKTVKMYSSCNWVLTKGTGYIGYLLLILYFMAIIRVVLDKERNKNCLLIRNIGIPILCGFIFFLVSTVWYDWSFRYVAPYLMVMYFVSVVLLEKYEERHKIVSKVAIGLLVVGSIMNSVSAFRWGQAYPLDAKEIQKLPETQQKLIFSSLPQYDDLAEVPGLMDILSSGGEALVYDTFSYAYYQFFGDNHCVYLDLAYDEEALIEKANDKNYDFYVIATTKEDTENYERAREYFEKEGCKTYETSNGLIFMRR